MDFSVFGTPADRLSGDKREEKPLIGSEDEAQVPFPPAIASIKDGLALAKQRSSRGSLSSPGGQPKKDWIDKAIARAETSAPQSSYFQYIPEARSAPAVGSNYYYQYERGAQEIGQKPVLGGKQMMGLRHREGLKEQAERAAREAAQQPAGQAVAPQQEIQQRNGLIPKAPISEADAQHPSVPATPIAPQTLSALPQAPATVMAPVAAPAIEEPVRAEGDPMNQALKAAIQEKVQEVQDLAELTVGFKELGINFKAVDQAKDELEKLCRTQSAIQQTQRKIKRAKHKLEDLTKSGEYIQGRVKTIATELSRLVDNVPMKRRALDNLIKNRTSLRHDDIEENEKDIVSKKAEITELNKQIKVTRSLLIYNNNYLKKLNQLETASQCEEISALERLLAKLGSNFLGDPVPQQNECARVLKEIRSRLNVEISDQWPIINGRIGPIGVKIGRLWEQFKADTAAFAVKDYSQTLEGTAAFLREMKGILDDKRALNLRMDDLRLKGMLAVDETEELQGLEKEALRLEKQALSLMNQRCLILERLLYKKLEEQEELFEVLRLCGQPLPDVMLTKENITNQVGAFRLKLLNTVDGALFVSPTHLKMMIAWQEQLNNRATIPYQERDVLNVKKAQGKAQSRKLSWKEKVSQFKQTSATAFDQFKQGRKISSKRKSVEKETRIVWNSKMDFASKQAQLGSPLIADDEELP